MSHIQLRIDPEEKAEAQKVLKSMGLSVSGGIKLFLKEVVKQKKLPFEIVAAQEVIKKEIPRPAPIHTAPAFKPDPKPQTKEELDSPVKTWNPFQQRRIG